MTKGSRHALVLVLLISIPFLVVKGIKGRQGTLSDVPTARQKGDPNAKVLITEYSDFQCPACAHIQPFLKELMKRFEGKVRLGFKHHPLKKTHRNALRAAHAAECAADQNQFWAYHDKLFEMQKSWSGLIDPTSEFLKYADTMALDKDKFSACLKDPSRLVPIEMDLMEAERLGVRSTPTFFIGEERLVGGVFRAKGTRTVKEQLQW